jgi:hypothetical protein
MFAQLGVWAGTLAAKALAAALLFVAGVLLGWKLCGDRWETRHGAALLAAAEAAGRRQAEYREMERGMQAEVDAARGRASAAEADSRKLTGEIDALNRSVGAIRLDRDRLRRDLAGFAGGPTAGDSLSSCVARAGRLAELLADGEGLVSRCGDLVRRGAELAAETSGAAEVRGIKLRACLEAWP